MPHFSLTTQQPKPKILGEGSLSISEKGEAQFFAGDAESNAPILATMFRVRIEWAGAVGVFISGMEPTGFDRAGKQKFRHQEWLLRHLNPNVNSQKNKREQPIAKTDLELLFEVKLFCSIKTDVALAEKISSVTQNVSQIRSGKRGLTAFEKLRCYDLLGYAWAKEALAVLFPERIL